MKVKIEVFTSPTCPHCPSAIRLAKSVEKVIPDVVKVVETSSASYHGFQRMKKFNIMATPTIMISGPAIPDKIGFRGTPSKNKFIDAISEASGMSKKEIINKMKSSKYHQASSYEIRFGTIKAAQIKKRISKQTSGSNNPNAAVWLLTNPQGDTVELFNLKEDLNNLALPYGTLKDSYRYNRAVKRGIAKDWQLKRK